MLLLWALVLLPVQDLDAQAQSVADRAGDLDPAVRAEAATEAARLADKLDPTPSKRASPLIVRVLAWKGDGAALFRLADRNLRGVGCDFIVPAKDNVQDLLRLLDGKDIALRIAACRALGRLEDPELRKSVSSAMGHGMRRTNSLDQLFALVSGLWGGPGNPAHFAIGDGDPERAALAIAAMVNFPGLNVPEAFAPALLRSLEQEKTDRTFRSLLIRGVGRRSPWVLLPLLPIRDRKFRSEIVGVLDLSLRDPLVAPAVAAAWRGAKKLDDGRNPPQPMTAWIEAWIERLCGEGVTPENVPAWMQASFRPLLDKQADAAIRRGAAALGKKTFVKLSPGVHALTAYALLKCDEPAAARFLDALLERDPDNVYAASLAAMAFATALEKGVDKPERVARRARRMAEVLADSQLRSGGWSYVARVYPDQTLGGWGYDL
ncbi:MAG: hypothetical protein HY293_12910 [Planctomycetes bacterium]|nr:hypothetical protein [Planctomycetota bacterium]